MLDAGLNSLLDQLAPLRHKNTRFLFAAAAVFGAVAIAGAAEFVFQPAAALIFAVAVVACTALLGLTAGLASAALAVFSVDFFFVPPIFQFNLDPLMLRAAIELSALAVLTHIVERRVSNQIRSKKKMPLGIHGQLDGIRDGEVYGWAMDCDHPVEPVLVTILVDGRPMAEVAAVYYRADIETGLQSSGSYGFCVDLSRRVTADREAVVEARTSGGQALKNSPQTMTIPARPHAPGPAILFMHIPKTAGIAFREAITANYPQSAVAYLYGTAPGFLAPDLRRLPLEQRRDFRFVMGHFQYGLHHDLPQDALYVTMVREPAARALSQYAMLQRTEPELLKQHGRTLPLEELLERKPHIHFDNALVRHFGAVDEREFPAGAVNQQLYEKALYYLRTGFTFIGHQEFAGNAYARMRERFGWSARPELEIVNAGTSCPDAGQIQRIRRAFEAFNRWDDLLYREILRLYPYPE
jgi:Domain of unknown function (DUF4118)